MTVWREGLSQGLKHCEDAGSQVSPTVQSVLLQPHSVLASRTGLELTGQGEMHWLGLESEEVRQESPAGHLLSWH